MPPDACGKTKKRGDSVKKRPAQDKALLVKIEAGLKAELASAAILEKTTSSGLVKTLISRYLAEIQKVAFLERPSL